MSRKQEDLSRAQYVYEQLLNGVRRGQFYPGQRLREVEVASMLSVSRTPVREALQRLASDGLIELASGRGMMITQLNKQQVRELYSLRKVLEGAAAGLAAQHASADEIASMQALLDTQRTPNLSAKKMARANLLFHQAIHDAAHNSYLSRALMQLSDSLALLPGTTFEVPGRSELAVEEHGAILRAIEARDSSLAEDAARKHIELASLARIRMMFEQE